MEKSSDCSVTHCTVYNDGLIRATGQGNRKYVSNVNGSLFLHRIVLIESVEVEVTQHIHPGERGRKSNCIL